MKIAQFTDTFIPVVDGAGRVVSHYAYDMATRCEKCYVIAPKTPALKETNFPFELITYHSVIVPTSPQYRSGIPIADRNYRKKMHDITVDIVHAHSPFVAGHSGIRFAKRQGVPMVASFHSKYYDDFLQVTKSKALAQIWTDATVNFFNKCDLVFAVSHSTAKVLRGYGYEGPVHVVENGMNIHAPAPDAIALAKQKLGLSGAPILLFVGQMNFKKNIRNVLKAAAMCKRHGASFQLVLAGQGPHLEDIKKLVEELNIADCVVIAGHVYDEKLLDGLYCAADLFVFPSLYDNAPMVVREAAAMGTPSLLVRGSDAAEIIEDNINGLLCENTPTDLSRTIIKALTNRYALSFMGKKAKETIPKPWAFIIDDVIQTYQRLIDEKKEKNLRS